MSNSLALYRNCVKNRDIRQPSSLHSSAEKLAKKHSLLSADQPACLATVSSVVRYLEVEFAQNRHVAVEWQLGCLTDGAVALYSHLTQRTADRSEEHTSELQSPY